MNASSLALKFSALALALTSIAPLVAQSNLSEARLLRGIKIPKAEPGPGLTAAPTPTADWAPSYSLGIAYTDFETGGHGWNVPFQLDLKRGAYTLTAQTDGYAIASDPIDASGFSDILLQAKRTWKVTGTTQVLSLSGGATVPVGGDMGSQRTKERVTGSFAFAPTDAVLVSASASLRRSEDARKAKRNPYTQVLASQAVVDLGDGYDTFLQFVAAHPNGGKWATTLIAGFDFPMMHGFTGTISLARGLNRGGKDTAIEFDLSW